MQIIKKVALLAFFGAMLSTSSFAQDFIITNNSGCDATIDLAWFCSPCDNDVSTQITLPPTFTFTATSSCPGGAVDPAGFIVNFYQPGTYIRMGKVSAAVSNCANNPMPNGSETVADCTGSPVTVTWSQLGADYMIVIN